METTTGPWIATTQNKENKPNAVICVKSITSDWIVAVCGVEGSPHEDTAIANAALIAVAPDMLDALIAIQETARMIDSISSQAVDSMISGIFAKLANEAGV